VEFALILPLLILLVFGAVDLGRAFYAFITITNAARVGARYGIVNETSTILNRNPYLNCPIIAPPATGDCDVETKIKTWVIKEAEQSGITILPGRISVLYPNGRVEFKSLVVKVDYQFDLILKFMFPSGILLSRQVEMRIP
jgi:hypothetical protein